MFSNSKVPKYKHSTDPVQDDCKEVTLWETLLHAAEPVKHRSLSWNLV